MVGVQQLQCLVAWKPCTWACESVHGSEDGNNCDLVPVSLQAQCMAAASQACSGPGCTYACSYGSSRIHRLTHCLPSAHAQHRAPKLLATIQPATLHAARYQCTAELQVSYTLAEMHNGAPKHSFACMATSAALGTHIHISAVQLGTAAPLALSSALGEHQPADPAATPSFTMNTTLR